MAKKRMVLDVEKMLEGVGEHENIFTAETIAQIMSKCDGDVFRLAEYCLHVGYVAGETEIKQKISKICVA